MIEALIVLGCLYASYRLCRKPGEKFYYDDKSRDYITHDRPIDSYRLASDSENRVGYY